MVEGGVTRRAGQPLIALAFVLIVWVAIRSMLWEAPFGHILEREAFATGGDAIAKSFEGIEGTVFRQHRVQDDSVPVLDLDTMALSGSGVAHRLGAPMSIFGMVGTPPVIQTPVTLKESQTTGDRPSAKPRTRSFLTDPSPIIVKPVARTDRWSLDSWVFLRQGRGVAAVTGPAPANYGASQAGAVLRYRLDPGNTHRPAAYLRATAALAGQSQADLAVGLSARPVPKVPLSVLVEARASRAEGRTELRPAALAVTEFPPIDLPLGLRGEAYGQAGYVGGDFATGFLDGQARVDRPVARIGNSRFAVGGGVWGGAQKGATRLDMGPTVRTDLTVADTQMRISIDYRHRVAGQATPESGLALTVSAGF
ncbi:MAG: hypothetical protein WA948_11615 [Pontixanthobacter sp.]